MFSLRENCSNCVNYNVQPGENMEENTSFVVGIVFPNFSTLMPGQ